MGPQVILITKHTGQFYPGTMLTGWVPNPSYTSYTPGN